MLASKPKLTPAKPALAGTVFSATVAEVLAPVASGLAIACVNDPLKSLNVGNWFSSVIGKTVGSKGAGVKVNSQSKAAAPHLSSHSIRYSCPATTPTTTELRGHLFGEWPSKELCKGKRMHEASPSRLFFHIYSNSQLIFGSFT